MSQLFYGTKAVKAEPMNRLEYNNFRGWALPPDENGEDEGYLVEYMDGGKPNVEGRSGYISWSPKEQFDKTYQSLKSLQDLGSFVRNFGHVRVTYEYLFTDSEVCDGCGGFPSHAHQYCIYI